MRNHIKRNLKTIVFSLLMIFVLTGCGNSNRNDDYRYDYYDMGYYEDSYDALISGLNRLSIHDLYDLAEMVYTAWEFGAYVEVDYFDYDGYLVSTEFVDDEQMLERFLTEIYLEEVYVIDAEVIEDELFNLFLVFTVEETYY